MKMRKAYCRWYDKKLEDVAEHEQEECKRNGYDCTDCPELTLKEYDEEADNAQ